MTLNVGRAVSGNRRWGVQLGWARVTRDICADVLEIEACEGTSEAFARAVYAWQEDQIRLVADGIIGPRSWRRVSRILRQHNVPVAASPDAGARACLNAFIFAPEHNSPIRTADATGMFHPASQAFARVHHTAEPFYFDNGPRDAPTPTGQRRREIFDALAAAPAGLDTVAYFGHGLSDKMSSAGIRMADIPDFARLIKSKARQTCKVLLYACRCGRPGGFAEALAAELAGNRSSVESRFEVYAHTESGQAHVNPTKKVFPEGRFIVEPNTRLFGRWRGALTTNHLWARYAYMREDELRAELGT